MRIGKVYLLSLLICNLAKSLNLEPIEAINPKIVSKLQKKYSDKENISYSYTKKNKLIYNIEVNCYQDSKFAKGSFNREIKVVTGMNLINSKEVKKPLAVNKITDGVVYLYLVNNCTVKEFVMNILEAKDLYNSELDYLNRL